ncbi:hypothetical protein DOTSEDRAFT_29317 [Dothistroma septosporum NZE10]|uniref:DUF6604 domain-containing protein n=1 Tax=Dothistroma septosporum (strain NZE10 / CBS 128990) TaxID=675120 RepID=N1PCW0_DOTSN|nr:hypothetical protein DOTSEDRAFT_29317 [Dothistroma septosporum NZE10]
MSLRAVESERISIARPVVAKVETTRFKLEQTQGEDLFALWCMFTDYSKLRVYLPTTWQECLDRKIGIHVAAELSDKAFEIVQHMTDEFARNIPTSVLPQKSQVV